MSVPATSRSSSSGRPTPGRPVPTHAFEELGLNRVEFLTGFRNDASRAAIGRLGATQEGVLRSHLVMRDGFVRDSVLFSVTAAEWPAVRQRLGAAPGRGRGPHGA